MKKYLPLILLIALFPVVSSAQLRLNTDIGGQNYAAGQQIVIEWGYDKENGKGTWDLYFSGDNGKKWNVIRENLNFSERKYTWSVPELETDAAMVKLVLNRGEERYEDVSDKFSINEANPSSTNLLAGEISLSAYPNPFSSVVNLEFSIPQTSSVSLEIYNILGERVKDLHNSILDPGDYIFRWDGSSFSSGLYFYSLKVNGKKETGRIVLKK